jgi:hypothetical protein
MSTHRKAAIAQHPLAMYRLGLADLNGDLGQPRKPKDGVKWLKRAAEVNIFFGPVQCHKQERSSYFDLMICSWPTRHIPIPCMSWRCCTNVVWSMSFLLTTIMQWSFWLGLPS